MDVNTKVRDLNDDETNRIRKVIEEQVRVEGNLRKGVSSNIKRLMEVGSYVDYGRRTPGKRPTYPHQRAHPKGPRRGGLGEEKSNGQNVTGEE